jgi:hypothetical protein
VSDERFGDVSAGVFVRHMSRDARTDEEGTIVETCASTGRTDDDDVEVVHQ